MVSTAMVQAELGCSFNTAAKLVASFEEAGILREITGRERGRLYRYEEYCRVFEEE